VSSQQFGRETISHARRLPKIITAPRRSARHSLPSSAPYNTNTFTRLTRVSVETITKQSVTFSKHLSIRVVHWSSFAEQYGVIETINTRHRGLNHSRLRRLTVQIQNQFVDGVSQTSRSSVWTIANRSTKGQRQTRTMAATKCLLLLAVLSLAAVNAAYEPAPDEDAQTRRDYNATQRQCKACCKLLGGPTWITRWTITKTCTMPKIFAFVK
jgi:hypothetical protein